MINLPRRTVELGKSNFCSPFYITYVSQSSFAEYYRLELARMQDAGIVSAYHEAADGGFFQAETIVGTPLRIEYQPDPKHSTAILSIRYPDSSATEQLK